MAASFAAFLIRFCKDVSPDVPGLAINPLTFLRNCSVLVNYFYLYFRCVELVPIPKQERSPSPKAPKEEARSKSPPKGSKVTGEKRRKPVIAAMVQEINDDEFEDDEESRKAPKKKKEVKQIPLVSTNKYPINA